MIQIDRIEQIILGQGEKLLDRAKYPDWETAFVALRRRLPTLTQRDEAVIMSHPDTQIGPVSELVNGIGTAYSAAVIYDVRIVE